MKAQTKATATVTPFRTYTIKAVSRKGDKLELPGWLIAPSGGFLPFQSVSKWDYIHLRPVQPRTKESLEAARAEYDKEFVTYSRLAQKAASELSSKEAVRLSARHIGKGKHAGKYGVSARYLADGGSVIEQFAKARQLAKEAREASVVAVK